VTEAELRESNLVRSFIIDGGKVEIKCGLDEEGQVEMREEDGPLFISS
jgi:hypothetical protein